MEARTTCVILYDMPYVHRQVISNNVGWYLVYHEQWDQAMAYDIQFVNVCQINLNWNDIDYTVRESISPI